jgi:hypothetical protein
MGTCRDSLMSEPINLSDVPRRFLNRTTWAKLRAFAPNDLLALVYMNAPHPDDEDPNDFFWDRSGSAAEAISCYQTGRSLLRQCRSLLSSKKLVATGRDVNGRRKTISSREWLDLWPMFATNRAVGPDRAFDEVQVFKAISSETPHTQLLSDCIAWLKEQSIAGLGEKKLALYEDARRKLGCALTHAIFDAAYLAVFARGRGRPRKIKTKSRN